jgi:hypothetical protein
MNVSILAAGNQTAPAISAGSKAGAILIGVAFLVVVYIVTALITGHWRLKELFNGFDGFGSTSKLQWLLWLVVILFGYAAIWVLRAEQGNYAALSNIPVNILTVLGFVQVGPVRDGRQVIAPDRDAWGVVPAGAVENLCGRSLAGWRLFLKFSGGRHEPFPMDLPYLIQHPGRQPQRKSPHCANRCADSPCA